MKKRFGGLVCSNCRGELELDIAYDGLSTDAVDYSKDNPNWDWEVKLSCTKCPRVYPIGRISALKKFSALKELPPSKDE